MYKLFVFLIIIYLFFRIFTRYILPWLLKYFIKKVMKNNLGNTDWQGDTDNTNTEDKKQVNINTKRNSPSKSHIKNDEGEYVDFTEIK